MQNLHGRFATNPNPLADVNGNGSVYMDVDVVVNCLLIYETGIENLSNNKNFL